MKISKASLAILIAAGILSIVASILVLLPFFAERYYRDGFNLVSAQQYLEGIDKLETAVALAPLESQYRVELGRAMEDYAKTQSPEIAIKWLYTAQKLYVRLIQLDDQNPWYQNRMASVYSMLAQFDIKNQSTHLKLAEKYTRNAAQFDPNNPLFQLNLAYFLQSTNRIDEAISYYQKAIQIDGRMGEARYNLGNIYLAQNKPDLALAQFIAILENNPNMAGVLPSIGRVYLTQNQPHAAIPYLEQNAKLYPFDKMGLLFLAQAYSQIGQTDKTIETLESIVKRFPDDVQSRKNLIILYRQTGRGSDAAQQEALLSAFLNSTQH